MSRRRVNKLGFVLAGAVAASASLAACGDEPPAEGQDGQGGMGGADAGPMPDELPDEAPTASGIVGGGLEFTIDDVVVTNDGTATVDFTIEDGDGRLLDLEGRTTEGEVEPRFILSWLAETEEGDSTQYTAYTRRTQEEESGESAEQPSYDTDGTFDPIAPGRYRYTFATSIDIPESREGLTHTLGVYATREVSGVRFVDTAIESWVPDGSEVETILDVVTTEACNDCHTRLEFHGGARRGVEMCNLCHTEEDVIDPGSGNSIEFQSMIHKIHMGRNLPSVQAGDEYFFVGYMGHETNYSNVAYPWQMDDCGKCHQGSQGERWITEVSLQGCQSCHDRTYFGEGEPPEGWTAHTAGPRDDSECTVCHSEDALTPVAASHVTSVTDPDRPDVTATVVGIENTSPGSLPRVEFSVSIDDQAVDLLTSPLDRLRLRIWGPTTGVASSWSEVLIDMGEEPAVQVPECGATPAPPCLEQTGDAFVYHAQTPIPNDAQGTYLVGLDGRESTVDGNVAFSNPVVAFAVTGDVVERRQIVALDQCNSCHEDLAVHGGNYKAPSYCLNCHNAEAYQGVGDLMAGESQTLLSINFKDLIHRVHSSTTYPAPLNDCSQCHLESSYTVPLPEDLSGSTFAVASCPDGGADCSESMGGTGNLPDTTEFETPPESAACSSCHSSASTEAHAETNRTASAEACGTCHGPGSFQAVEDVHELAP